MTDGEGRTMESIEGEASDTGNRFPATSDGNSEYVDSIDCATPNVESPSPEHPPKTTVLEASDAFQALGHQTRMDILAELLERTDGDDPSPPSFTELFEASSVDTTAGFAYHLDELVGPYLEKTEDGYVLTYAGERIAREIAAGSFTDSVHRESIPIDDPCPFCTAGELAGTARDNVVTIACGRCDRAVLRMEFPPGGFDAHGDALADAFDRHHRARIAQFRDGVCPACAGRVAADVESVDGEEGRPIADDAEETTSATENVDLVQENIDPVQAVFACERCGDGLRCPISLTLLDHPEVVSLFRDHGRSIQERPLWNVGAEWTETPIASDPTLVHVGITLDDERLACYVDGTVSVVATDRTSLDVDGVGTPAWSADGVSTNDDDDDDGSNGPGFGPTGSDADRSAGDGPELDESDAAEPSVNGSTTSGTGTADAAAGEGAA